MSGIAEHDWTVTEERRAMLDVLADADAPGEATVHVQKTDHAESESFIGRGHLRVSAEWHTEQEITPKETDHA